MPLRTFAGRSGWAAPYALAVNHATAGILSVGDELTLGQNLDTNSQWLSQRLLEVGIVPVEHATVPDDLGAQRDAILRLAGRADLVIATGGLGPTTDDLTRQALAAAMADELVEDPDSVEQIRARFMGRPMPENNRLQALRPSSGRAIPNANGTAPGLHGVVRSGDREVDVFCLPGPPREMRGMFQTGVAPHLRPRADRAVRTRTLHTYGLGESEVAKRLGPLMERSRNPMVGTTASRAIVSCRVRYEGPAAAADEAMRRAEEEIRERLGAYLFGADEETLPWVVLELLRWRGKRLAVVESCTGGLLGAFLTDVPGSSDVFVGGLVTYTNELKRRLAGVPEDLFGPARPGAVSREVAMAMARGGRERLGADYCLSITGVAGPGGGTAEKPVGTVWIGLVGEGVGEARRFLFPYDRTTVREWSVRAAAAMLRFGVIGEGELAILGQRERWVE